MISSKASAVYGVRSVVVHVLSSYVSLCLRREATYSMFGMYDGSQS